MNTAASLGVKEGISALTGGGGAAATPVSIAEAQSLASGGGGLMTVNPSPALMTEAPVASGLPATGVVPYLGAAGALAGAYGLHKGIQAGDRKTSALGGMALGGGLAAAAPLVGLGPVGWGALALSALGGGALGGLAGHVGGGKSQAQQTRDKLRQYAIEKGFAGKDFNVALADGSKFNIGLDGKATLKNQGVNIDGKNTRHFYDVDFSNPLAGKTVVALSPLISSLLGEGASEKQKSDLAGMFANAVMSNAKTFKDVQKNIGAIQRGAIGAPPTPKLPPRSKTKSPGISKDGKRIDY